MPTATGSFQVETWDEQPYHEDASGKLTQAIVAQAFSGGIAGRGEARWLMAYRPDGTAHFLGLQRVEGSVDGRQGAFVMATTGDFDGTTATWRVEIVEGTATGALAGITGSGRFGAEHGPEATYAVDFDFTG